MAAPTTIVRVAEGALEGVRSADGHTRSFKGIPYARPPVGPLRWREPAAPERWEGVRPALAFGPTAPQLPVVANSLYAGGHEHQSEDCLTLNVWTPGHSAGDRIPVMVWLHFGAYQFGGSSVALYDGERLAAAGAVVVTLNHRLGRLGFLSHPELSAQYAHGASGNYGIHDQIRALEWLAENVEEFGGDPGNVTVFGLSAGSMSVSLLMASPLARGLFHRADHRQRRAGNLPRPSRSEHEGHHRFGAAARARRAHGHRARPDPGREHDRRASRPHAARDHAGRARAGGRGPLAFRRGRRALSPRSARRRVPVSRRSPAARAAARDLRRGRPGARAADHGLGRG